MGKFDQVDIDGAICTINKEKEKKQEEFQKGSLECFAPGKFAGSPLIIVDQHDKRCICKSLLYERADGKIERMCFAKVDEEGRLQHPWRSPDTFLRNSTYIFKQISIVAFEHYVRFLQTHNNADYTIAERSKS